MLVPFVPVGARDAWTTSATALTYNNMRSVNKIHVD